MRQENGFLKRDFSAIFVIDTAFNKKLPFAHVIISSVMNNTYSNPSDPQKGFCGVFLCRGGNN
jgi:hypothetical protein